MDLGTTSDMFAFLTQLMTEHSNMFVATGSQMFRGLATILIAWFGVKSALGAVSGSQGPAFDFAGLANLLMLIAFGFGMLTYYSHPIPGLGMSFSQLIVNQGLTLSNQLEHAMVQEVWDRLNSVYLGLELPALTMLLNMQEAVRYALTAFFIIAAEAVMYAVIAFGYVAVAIAVMLGPVFIPFFIVPHMEWLFWGWFKSLIQYSFYPVIANAFLYVFGHVLIRFLDANPPPYDGARSLVLFGPMLLMLIAFVYGITRVPALVNSLFTGRSGEAAFPKVL